MELKYNHLEKLIKTKSLVLKKRNFGEYDRVLLLLTEDFGRIDVLAKGVRKPGSRLGGLSDSFLILQIEVEQRRGFDILKDAVLVEDYKMLEKSLAGLGVGGLLMEVVELLSVFGQDDQTIFNLVCDYLDCYQRNRLNFDKREKIELFLASFLMSVLALSGRLPIVLGCSICGKDVVSDLLMTEYGVCCKKCVSGNLVFGEMNRGIYDMYCQVATKSCDELINTESIYGAKEVMDYSFKLFDIYHKKELKSLDFLNEVYKNLS